MVVPFLKYSLTFKGKEMGSRRPPDLYRKRNPSLLIFYNSLGSKGQAVATAASGFQPQSMGHFSAFSRHCSLSRSLWLRLAPEGQAFLSSLRS
jgi:hypothetical protein